MNLAAKKITKFSAIIFLIAFFCFFDFKKIKAEDCEEKCLIYADEDQRKDCEDQCEKLNEKAKVYEKILELNDKQQDTLFDQLDYINQQQQQNYQNLQSVQSKIDELSAKIRRLENDIAEKGKSIAYQKKILTNLMQSYYDYDQQGLLEIVIAGKNLSESLSQSDYIEQSGVKASDILDEIQASEKELVQEQEDLKISYDENQKTLDKLQYAKENLQLSENQKTSLLIKTQGEEQKYTDLLAHIEEQKKELFNFSGASNLGEILDSVSKYDKPNKSNWASTSWYFSQRDSRWANQRIGNSKSLMKDYGCAVSSVAMVFRKLGSNTDPGKMAKEKIFYYDLIKWPGSWSPGIDLASSVSHGNISWSKIDSQIKNGNPVIVYIKKTNGGGGHYVVVTGKDKKDYIVHDPYFGSNLYLGTSKSLVGKIGADSKTTVDQMIIYN